MDDNEIAKFKEQLRLRKLGVAMYELQTILGQKISAEEKTQRANNYYKTLDNGIKNEGTILNLMYKITGQKIEAKEYTPPINQQLQTNEVENTAQPKSQTQNQNISAPTQITTFPITSYLSIRDVEEQDDEKLLKQGRDKPVSNSIFVINQISSTEATLETYKEMKTNFFNSFYRSLSGFVFAFEVIGSPSFEDDAVETVEKGKLIKEDEYWKIEQKSKIQFKKEEE
ncbi:hypothetical protein Fleli_1800 [Bernardetia litoralis DSM 6794]|uniref:Uncharacterized protein n=1 Tax=Bernardetia litoralis (strain ATCC 23117 / DSM 6794 / NBRC 15988 / NCIMB 1366 / Fx l1 / Sio-4) TaxID=880071 RepID=I4AJR3_BERLS|nr:hypothetical protein [Bernardetia litoralis]AFM04198.1 hypothetical protein Fleli_1800 [Bernardetia litoralis DSM 6794]